MESGIEVTTSFFRQAQKDKHALETLLCPQLPQNFHDKPRLVLVPKRPIFHHEFLLRTRCTHPDFPNYCEMLIKANTAHEAFAIFELFYHNLHPDFWNTHITRVKVKHHAS